MFRIARGLIIEPATDRLYEEDQWQLLKYPKEGSTFLSSELVGAPLKKLF